MYPYFLRAVLALGLLFVMTRLSAQCNPDVTPPVAVCNQFINVSLDANGEAVVSSNIIDEGSYDLCCLDTLLIRRVLDGPCDADTLADDFSGQVTFCCSDVGSGPLTVVLRAYDCSGNTNECWAEVTVADKLAPFCIAPSDVVVSCEDYDPSLVQYGEAQAQDNCTLDTVTVTNNFSQFDSICLNGTIIRVFEAKDAAGQSSQCTQTITVNYNQHYFIRFPNDLILSAPDPGGNYGEPDFFDEDCELLGVSFEDEIFNVVPGASLKIERTWTVVNWCTYDDTKALIFVPNPNPNADPNHPANLPGPTISASGTPAPWQSTIVKISPTDPSATDYSTFWAQNANGYRYKQIIKINYPDPVTFRGNIFSDTLENCLSDAGEDYLENWTVKIHGLNSGQIHSVQTDASGYYQQTLPALLDTLFELSVSLPFNNGSCPTSYSVTAAAGDTVDQDFAIHLEEDCPLLTVDLSTLALRRCFPGKYTVQACNLSTGTIPDVYVEVELDSYFDYLTASIPATDLGSNIYSFDLGDLPPGVCEQFDVFFDLNCDAPLGYTHCTSAHVYPDTVCNSSPAWSGANVAVQAFCDGDSVRFIIQNTGAGDMFEPLDFVVVEDVIMFQSGTFQLNSGLSQPFAVPANGATWRLEAEQEPNHPWGGVVAAALEACGGFNTPGLVTQFPLNSPNPFESTDCRENIGSYDPNDKQAFPRGYGNDHLVEANTDLEYLIRFQNTGTDTAFTVVVLDTLSQHLDISKVRPGATSHPCDFSILDGNVLRFRFDNILLPDSNVNEAASHGFLKFRVSQQPDLADGIRIENSAAIYFDFNDPVITNTTFHTIGDHFILVKTDPGPENLPPLQVAPNPAREAVIFESSVWLEQGKFQLLNSVGQPIREENFTGVQYRFERKNLASGLYFYQITNGGNARWTGKLILK